MYKIAGEASPPACSRHGPYPGTLRRYLRRHQDVMALPDQTRLRHVLLRFDAGGHGPLSGSYLSTLESEVPVYQLSSRQFTSYEALPQGGGHGSRRTSSALVKPPGWSSVSTNRAMTERPDTERYGKGAEAPSSPTLRLATVLRRRSEIVEKHLAEVSKQSTTSSTTRLDARTSSSSCGFGRSHCHEDASTLPDEAGQEGRYGGTMHLPIVRSLSITCARRCLRRERIAVLDREGSRVLRGQSIPRQVEALYDDPLHPLIVGGHTDWDPALSRGQDAAVYKNLGSLPSRGTVGIIETTPSPSPRGGRDPDGW